MNTRLFYLLYYTMGNLYGLIGYPLKHSFSPAYFKNKFATENIDAEYRAFPIKSIEYIQSLLEEYPSLSGLNVTIPYKADIIEYVDNMDADAEKVQAINCIKIKDGKTIGYNTDIIGFAESLAPLLQPNMDKALVLGSGGASRAVQFVLNKLDIDFQVVSRAKTDHSILYQEVTDKLIGKHKLIINTTPLGMYPNIDSSPEIPYDTITPEHLLYDLIYNPVATKFLQIGKQKGAMTKNGQEMLELQADASWKVWNL